MRRQVTVQLSQREFARASALPTTAMRWVATVLLLTGLANLAAAQESEQLPLHERDPFDRLTLDDENASAQIEVFPIQSIDRTKRVAVAPKSVTIRRLQDPPDRRYSVNGKHIVKLELFPFILLDEANQLIAAGQVDEAFPLLGRLKNEYPSTPGIAQATEEFFFADARFLFQQRRYDEALQALEEVYRLNGSRAGLPRILERVLSEIIQIEYREANYESVRKKLEYARRKYSSATKSTIDLWETRLKQDATKQIALARQSLASGDASQALALARNAAEIWPTAEGIQELNKSVLKKYPRVRVAVTQAYQQPSEADASVGRFSWAARRVTPLVTRQFVRFKQFTADGGEYECRIGNLEILPNRAQIDVVLRPEYSDKIHQFSRALLQLATPDHPSYSIRWAEYLGSIYVASANRIQITLTRPALRPEGLLPREVPSLTGDRMLLVGDFDITTSASQVQAFRARNPSQDDLEISEITEHYFSDPADATAALLDGQVEIIDRIQPADLRTLTQRPTLRILEYRLPTIHGLVFNDREPLLRSSTFRRGLLRGIDREGFVRNELIAGGEKQIAQVISGFTPLGASKNDPLGYAYDRRIEPRNYNPALGLFLLRLAVAQRDQLLADSAEQPPPATLATGAPSETTEGDLKNNVIGTIYELPALALAYPNSPIAASACQSIAADLQKIGIEIQLRPLSAGQTRPADNDWDMLYIETTIEEPIVDFPELILEQSILGRHGGLIWQATRTLQASTDLAEVRDQFMRIHKLTYDHTPMIPLWQVIEHAAAAEYIAGIPEAPISLYHDISNWRLNP